jgi:hypothetical protein
MGGHRKRLRPQDAQQTDAERIAALERQVAELAAQVETMRRAFAGRTALDAIDRHIEARFGAAGAALEHAFAAGRASVREGAGARPASRSDHLRVVQGGAG